MASEPFRKNYFYWVIVILIIILGNCTNAITVDDIEEHASHASKLDKLIQMDEATARASIPEVLPYHLTPNDLDFNGTNTYTYRHNFNKSKIIYSVTDDVKTIEWCIDTTDYSRILRDSILHLNDYHLIESESTPSPYFYSPNQIMLYVFNDYELDSTVFPIMYQYSKFHDDFSKHKYGR